MRRAIILMIVGFAAIAQAVTHRQAGVKSLLSNAAARNDNQEEFGSDLNLESGCNKGPCQLERQEPCGCGLEAEGPQGTVSVSMGSSESYNCNDSAFTTFNFPTIDDYQKSGLADYDDECQMQKPRRCRQPQPPVATPYVAARPKSESCQGNIKKAIGATNPSN